MQIKTRPEYHTYLAKELKFKIMLQHQMLAGIQKHGLFRHSW